MGRLRSKFGIRRPLRRFFTGGNTVARVRWWWAQRDKTIRADAGPEPHVPDIKPHFGPLPPSITGFNPGIGHWDDNALWSDKVNWKDS